MKFSKYNTIINKSGVIDLLKEVSYDYDTVDEYCTTSYMVYKIATEILHMDLYSEEYLYLFCFNTKMRLQSIFEVSHGTCDTSLARGREIFQKALLANAVNIILVHNHPSGDPHPSECDIALTKDMMNVGKIIGIELKDHIIIGSGPYISLYENGYIDKGVKV